MPDEKSSPDLPLEGPDSDEGRSARLAEIVFSAIWVSFGIAVIAYSQATLRVPADRFPSLAGGVIAAMGGLRLMQMLRGATFRFPVTESPDRANTSMLFGGLWLLAALIIFVGLAWGGFVWGVLVLRFVYRWSWIRSVIYSAAFSVVIFLTFPALGLALPKGIFFGP